MTDSRCYVLAVQLNDPAHFLAVFGAAVVEVAHADLTRGVEEFCGRLLSRYRRCGEVASPEFGRWYCLFAEKASLMRTDMEEQRPVLREIGAVMMHELLIGCFGQATGSRQGFNLVIAETDAVDPESIESAVNQALSEETGASLMRADVSEDYLRQLVNGGGLLSYFQPIVELQNGTTVGYEALTRGPVDSAVHLADGLFGAARYHRLTDVLELACLRRAIEWLKAIPEPLWISVNLGPALLISPEFGQFVRDPKIAPLLPRVVFELTEHVPVASVAGLHDAVSGLLPSGLRLSLDDTGCGFFDLTTVETMRPEIVKLCITVVSRIGCSAEVDSGMQRTIHAVKRLGALILGEGVENVHQAEVLKRSGAAYAQGHYFGRPKPAIELFPL
ncbi:EAL domain-containing protein [Methylomicrobium agile]|uniref:EAL domain-containing protein n=1 Tax=Methylomicrobium agile TaxID=39774 RepID=UPI0004DFC8AF|nr:EAL domain-containing protein [Methylomicrobium agile]